MSHFLRDRRHGQHFFLVEISEEKKLRERNVPGCQFLAQMQHKTALHFENDVRKPLGVGTDFVGRALRERSLSVQSPVS